MRVVLGKLDSIESLLMQLVDTTNQLDAMQPIHIGSIKIDPRAEGSSSAADSIIQV